MSHDYVYALYLELPMMVRRRKAEHAGEGPVLFGPMFRRHRVAPYLWRPRGRMQVCACDIPPVMPVLGRREGASPAEGPWRSWAWKTTSSSRARERIQVESVEEDGAADDLKRQHAPMTGNEGL